MSTTHGWAPGALGTPAQALSTVPEESSLESSPGPQAGSRGVSAEADAAKPGTDEGRGLSNLPAFGRPAVSLVADFLPGAPALLPWLGEKGGRVYSLWLQKQLKKVLKLMPFETLASSGVIQQTSWAGLRGRSQIPESRTLIREAGNKGISCGNGGFGGLMQPVSTVARRGDKRPILPRRELGLWVKGGMPAQRILRAVMCALPVLFKAA